MAEQNAKWYVVHTYSGYENKVANDLQVMVENRGMQDLIQDIRIPMEQYTVIKDGQEITKERKLFPSYVYIKMIVNDDTWYLVRNINGCTGFVGPGSDPVPLSEAEVARVFNEQKHSVESDITVGAKVNIISGPLEGHSGVVQEINLEEKTLDVLLSMFGQEVPVSMLLEQVQLAQ